MDYFTSIEDAQHTFSDLYKDAHGIRPRWMRIEDHTLEELNEMAEGLQAMIEFEIEQEKKNQEESVEILNGTIQTCINAGAKDRITALRWLMEAEEIDTTYKLDGWMWDRGLSEYSVHGQNFINELKAGGLVV
jgi:hypothetical protein